MMDNLELTYYILGVWDQDDDLNIISSETKLAKSLLGLKIGDQVTLPDGDATIEDILSLSSEIRTWIAE